MPNLIHISLVSRQPMPNLIPALKYKPTLVVLLATKEEKHTAENLKKVLEEKHVQSIIVKEFLEPYNLKKNREIVNKIIYKYKDEILVLNITGGTKLMAISAFQCFTSKNLCSIYCDTEHNKIIKIQEDNMEEEQINVSISVRDYLAAHGYEMNDELKSRELDSEFLGIVDRNIISFSEFMEDAKRKTDFSKANSSWQNVNFSFHKNLDKITIKHHETNYKFATSMSGFNNGRWLEELTFHKIQQMKESGELDSNDIRMNVKLQSRTNIRNEIDVAFTHNSKLHLISCKAKFNDDKSDLYELDTLRTIAGGTFGAAFIIVTHKPSDAFTKRARELNIKVIEIYKFDKYCFCNIAS